MEGWIKLHRNIKDHWIWKSQNRFQWWVDILLSVNHTDNKVLLKGDLIECKRGQSIRSLESWAKDWNVTKKTVKDFFELLQKDSMLVHESLKFSTRITVCNYDNYQDAVNVKEKISKRSVNAEETMTTPKQECKERKEEETPLPLTPKKPSAKERSFEYLPIAKKLSRIIQETKNITHEKQQIHSWANDIRKLVETNGVSVERINKGLDYLQEHSGEMYCPEIESGASLKKKFGSLEGQMKKANYTQTFKCPSNWKFGVDYEEGKQGCRNCEEYHPNIHAACKLKKQSR